MALKFRPLRLGQCRSLDLEKAWGEIGEILEQQSKGRKTSKKNPERANDMTHCRGGGAAADSRPLTVFLPSRLDSLTLGAPFCPLGHGTSSLKAIERSKGFFCWWWWVFCFWRQGLSM